jgi:hypothetical protein
LEVLRLEDFAFSGFGWNVTEVGFLEFDVGEIHELVWSHFESVFMSNFVVGFNHSPVGEVNSKSVGFFFLGFVLFVVLEFPGIELVQSWGGDGLHLLVVGEEDSSRHQSQ